MPKLKSDREETWTLDRSGLTWILPENTNIRVGMNDYGIYDETGDNRIRVFGNMLGDDAAVGIRAGEESSVYIGANAWIAGFRTGIYGEDGDMTVINRGLIQSDYAISGQSGKVVNFGSIVSEGTSNPAPGVMFERWVDIVNEGLISARVAVMSFDGGSVFNGTDGVIMGRRSAVDLGTADGEVNTIENHGILRGRDHSISSSGETRIVNRGTIFGDIELGGFADRIDTRGGAVRGVIRGGEGDDTYLISSQYIVIEDNGSSTGDVVKSTSSFKLTGGLDDLFLLGATATAGYGNAGDNMLHGSRAINTLYGLDGADILSGGRGRDLLVGGAGADEFRFHKGFGVDTINDFTSGEDLIVSNLVVGVRDFERLDIRQRGPDTIIDFGHGDRLILEAFDGKNLSIGDFSTN